MKKVTAHLILFALLFLLISQAAHAERDREIMRLGRGQATSLDWRPDGKVLAVSSSSGVWFFNDNMEQMQHADIGSVQALEWNPNGKTLLIKRENDQAQIWTVNDAVTSVKKQVDLAVAGQSFDWSFDGKWIAISKGIFKNGNYTGTIQIVDAQTGTTKNSIDGLKYPPYPYWSPNSLSLAIQTSDNTVEIMDSQTGKTISTYQSLGAKDYISTFAFEDTDSLLILNEFDSNLYTWTVSTNQRTFKKISDYNDCLAYSIRPSNKGTVYFCSGFNGGYDTLYLIPESGNSSQQFGTKDSILSYKWRPNTRFLTILYNRGSLETWDTQTKKTESYQLFISPNQFSWSPDSKYLAASSGTYGYDVAYPVAVWKIDDNSHHSPIPQLDSIVYPLMSTKWIGWQNNQILLTYSDNETLATSLCFVYELESWNAATSQKANMDYEFGMCGIDDLPADWKYRIEWSEDFKWVAYLEGDHINIAPSTPSEATRISFTPNITVQSMHWSPDNSRLLVNGIMDKTNETLLEILDTQSGILLNKLSNVSAEPFWSPDSTKFAITSGSEIKIFDANGKLDFTHNLTFQSAILSWSPDSQKIAITQETSDEKRIEIIDALSNKSWFSYASKTANLVWSINGKYIIYPEDSTNQMVFVNITTGIEVARLKNEPVDSITLSPDGTMLALGMDDGTIRVWDVSDLMAN